MTVQSRDDRAKQDERYVQTKISGTTSSVLSFWRCKKIPFKPWSAPANISDHHQPAEADLQSASAEFHGDKRSSPTSPSR